MIVYDHTDCVHSGLNTGIQRVVRQLGRALEEQAPGLVVPSVRRNGRFYPFPIGERLEGTLSHGVRRLAWKLGDGPLAALRRLSNRNRTLARLKRGVFSCLEIVESRKTALKLKAGDWYFTADSIWTSPEIFDQLPRLKAKGVRTAIVLLDLIPVTHPHLVHVNNRVRFVPYAAALPSFDVVFCISNFVREQFLRFCQERGRPAPPHVVTIPMGYRFSQSDGEVPSGYEPRGPAGRFALCVATFEPRKNHRVLLDAFDLLWERGVDLSLVLVGIPSFDYEDLVERIRRHRLLGDRLFYFPRCPDGELEALYRRCDITVLPSVIEGYGLPLVESLARGKPCVCSDIPVFREVVGPFGLYVDPQDARDIADGIERLCHDPARYAALAAAIRTQFVPPKWEDSARLVLETLDVAAARPAR